MLTASQTLRLFYLSNNYKLQLRRIMYFYITFNKNIISPSSKVFEMAAVDGLKDMAYSFFTEKIVQRTVLKYQERNANTQYYCTPTNREPIIINVLMKCITEYKLSKQQVRIFILRSNVKHLWNIVHPQTIYFKT